MLLVFLCAACSASASREGALIGDFFAAARLQDTAALSSISRVTFNPRTEGTVQQFTVRRVSVPRQDGTASREEVTVDAQVRTPGGDVQPRVLVFTLERTSDGRWMIVDVSRSST